MIDNRSLLAAAALFFVSLFTNVAHAESAMCCGGPTPPPVLLISGGPTFDFGSKPAGSATDAVFTVTNNGLQTATDFKSFGASDAFYFKGLQFPGTGGTCGSLLPPHGSCTLVVTFAPPTAGNFADSLDLRYAADNGGEQTSRALRGTGLAPAALVMGAGTPYDFGDVLLGNTNIVYMGIVNNGGVAATGLGGSALPPPFSYYLGTYPGSGGSCGDYLAVGGTCTIAVAFKPSAIGSFSAVVSMQYNDGVRMRTASRPVQGKGMPR